MFLNENYNLPISHLTISFLLSYLILSHLPFNISQSAISSSSFHSDIDVFEIHEAFAGMNDGGRL